MTRDMALRCPRDGTLLRETTIGQATVDVCSKCDGTFFDSRELFTTSWDRPETGGAVKESKLRCPRCEPALMHAQDVSHGGKHVEIDRCGKCKGVWLDKSELDTLLAIGEALQPVVAAEQAKAEQELAKLGDVSFKTRWKMWPIVVAVLVQVMLGERGVRRIAVERAWEGEIERLC